MNKFMVLVVEDDKLIQNLMSTTLSIHNYRYLTASNASDALLTIRMSSFWILGCRIWTALT